MANRQNTGGAESAHNFLPAANSSRPEAGPADVHEEQGSAEKTDGEGLGPDAHIWSLLLWELGVHDAKSLQGLRDHLDADIVFTGLFAAVVTSFVVQSSQTLQPDHNEISTALLTELIAVQRAASNGWPVNEVPPSVLQMNAVTASVNDYWTNRLWLLSLTLSLFAAFMAFVIRGWLHAYDEPVSGPVKRQALVRLYRRMGFERWGIPSIIPILPLLLHTSLLMFFLGLVFYNSDSDPAMARVLAALTALFYSLYLLSNIFPVIYPDCPYDSPVSYYAYLVLVRGWGWLWRMLLALQIRSEHPGPHSRPRARSDPLTWTLRSREMEVVTRHWDDLATKNLAWALSKSANPTLVGAAVRAVFTLFRSPFQASTRAEDRVAEGIAGRLCVMLESSAMPLDWDVEQEDEIQLFAQNLLVLADDKDQDVDAYKGFITHVINSIERVLSSKTRPLPPVLEAAVLALADPLVEPPASLQVLFPFLFPKARTSAISSSDELTYWSESSLAGPLFPTGLKLDSLIWSHMIGYFAYASYFSSRQCLHLALFLWRNMDPTAQIRSGNERQSKKEAVTLEWMCTTEGQSGFRKDVQRAIHRLLMCSEESCDAYKVSNKGTGKEKRDIVDRDADEDEAVWLHMSDRAISAYAFLAQDARLMSSTQVNQNEIELKDLDQANIGFLAATFVHFLRPHYSLEFISTADKLAGLPGVNLDTHSKLVSRCRQAVNLLADDELHRDDVKALFKFLVKLLKVCPITEHRAHNVHIDTVRTLGRLVDLSSSAVYDAIIENRINPFDILRPLADASVSNPSSGPLSQALASMLASFVDNAVQSLRHLIHMSSLQLVGTTRDAEQSEFLVWCVWIDVLSTTQTGQSTTSASRQQGGTQAQQASGPPPAPSIALQPSQSSDAQPGQQITESALHQALKTLIGVITPQSRAEWLYRLERALEEPLPLAVGMALNEWRGYEAFCELLHAMSDFQEPLFSRTVAVKRLLTTARVRVQVSNDGQIINPKQDCLIDPEQAYPHDTTTLPLSGLLTLQEYRRKMDATLPPESISESRTDVASMDMAASPQRSRDFSHILTDYLNKLLGPLSPYRKTNRGAVEININGMASQA